MLTLTRGTAARWLDALLHIHDSPRRTAAAYALGVFFGFSPFLGLHTVLALACAFALNVNRVAVLLGVYSNLPWIIAAYYALATAGGAALLGVEMPPQFASELDRLFELSLLQSGFWRQLATLLRPFFWPYMLGSMIGAALLAWLAYRVALVFLETRRRHASRGAPTGA